MWTHQYSSETTATPDAIFDLFERVDSWNEWNPGVERIDLNGPFASGTTGTMVMPGQESLAFRLVWVEAGRGFEDETEIREADVVVRVRHSLDVLPEGRTRITYAATIDGVGADAVGPTIGPAITADFPEVVAALIARAEAAEAAA